MGDRALARRTAAAHAKVLRPGAHPDAPGMARLHHLVRDLAHQIFLNLEAPGVGVDQARQLAETEDPIARLVAQVHLTKERKEVVGADRDMAIQGLSAL